MPPLSNFLPLVRPTLYTCGMKSREHTPRKLDVGAFIEEQARLDGEAPVAAMARLASCLAEGADLDVLPPVRWSAQGRLVPQRVGRPELWLDLHAEAHLPWECQRCLHPVLLDEVIDRSVRFVADEKSAETLDAESEDDVLAVTRQFDLLSLIEDELIMEQPILPRHEQCPTDIGALMASDQVVMPDGSAMDEAAVQAAEAAKPNPFAALAALKKEKGDKG